MSLIYSKVEGYIIQVSNAKFGEHDVPVAYFRERHMKDTSIYITMTSLVAPSGVSVTTLKGYAKKLEIGPVVDESFKIICRRHNLNFLKAPNHKYYNLRDVIDVLQSCTEESRPDIVAFKNDVIIRQDTDFSKFSKFSKFVCDKEGSNDMTSTCSICHTLPATLDLCKSCSEGNLLDRVDLCNDYDIGFRWCDHCNREIKNDYIGICYSCLSSIERKALWPEDLEYINCIRTFQGHKTEDYHLPPMRSDLVELRKLPKDHPAYGSDENLGLFAKVDIRQSSSGLATVIGYYAGVFRPDRTVPMNPYIMATDNSDDMVYDAFSCGNELRFINAYDKVKRYSNVKMGRARSVSNFPSWLTARPIIIIRNIKAGEEILLDYGKQYWRAIKANAEIAQQASLQKIEQRWTPSPGSLIEIDMDQVTDRNLKNATSYRSSLFPATLIKIEGDNAEVTIFGVDSFQLPREAIFPPRNGFRRAVFQPGQEVEVLWKGQGDKADQVTRFDVGWWPATIIGSEPDDHYRVIYNAAFDGYATRDNVRSEYIRPITEYRMAFQPHQKKRKTVRK